MLAALIWGVVSIAGAGGWAVLALHRGESVNAAWLLLAAICTYLVGYRFYSRFIATRVVRLDDRRVTPAHRLANGRDFVPTSRWVLFGHHFAAIAGAGPLVGPVLAAQFGYLPGTIWIVVGVVLAGAVQDFVILAASVRRDGKSLGQMAKEEVGPVTGWCAMVAILAIMVILLAVLALVIVKALAQSPVGSVHPGVHHPDCIAGRVLDEGGAPGPYPRGNRRRPRAGDGGALAREDGWRIRPPWRRSSPGNRSPLPGP